MNRVFQCWRRRRVSRWAALLMLLAMVGGATAFLPPPAGAGSGDADDRGRTDPERLATLRRKGGGLRVGHWILSGPPEVSGAENSQTPVLEGYFQKGFDLHVTVESSIGFWRRTQESSGSGGIGGSSSEKIATYVIPSITSVKLYPFTTPEDRVEPFIIGGIGVALGLDDRSTTSGGIFGVTDSNGVLSSLGLGFSVGGGCDWRWNKAWGGSAGAHYRWIRFDQALGGADTYKGAGIYAGFTYRFQYE